MAPSRDTADWLEDVADAIRPALNAYPDGMIRVSRGQTEVADAVVQLVVKALEDVGFTLIEPGRPIETPQECAR